MFRSKSDGNKPDANSGTSAATTPPAAPSAAPAAAAPAPTAEIRYVDQPDCLESFADTVTGLSFDGQTLRIEFAVTRLDELRQNQKVTGRRYPVARIVLPPTAAVDLINKMQQIANALTQAGVVKARNPVADTPPSGGRKA